MAKSKSSRRWLNEHFSDPYVKEAQKAGYRSRAVYKLLDIQEKDHMIKPGMTLVDLGAAPGGWSQVAVDLLKGNGKIFALDILPMEPIDGVDFLCGDFTEQEVLTNLLNSIGNHKVDVVLSDMAPNMSGIKGVDQTKVIYLAELALDLANKMLKPGGTFLVKVFQGEGFDQYLKEMRAVFKTVKVRKPEASRSRSKEVYLLGIAIK